MVEPFRHRVLGRQVQRIKDRSRYHATLLQEVVEAFLTAAGAAISAMTSTLVPDHARFVAFALPTHRRSFLALRTAKIFA